MEYGHASIKIATNVLFFDSSHMAEVGLKCAETLGIKLGSTVVDTNTLATDLNYDPSPEKSIAS